MRNCNVQIVVILAIWCIVTVIAAEESETKKAPIKKKDIRDFNDVDMERLFDEWEAGEEEPDKDDLPEHLREAPKLDLSKMDPSNPESMMKMTKKGKTLMMFVSVSGDPTQPEAEEITKLWQDQLFQAGYQLQRYMVSSNRAIFMVTDGSNAWEIKDFIIDQEQCLSVTIDQQEYPGRGADKIEDTETKSVKNKKKKDKKGKKEKDKKGKKDKDKKGKKDKDKKDKKNSNSKKTEKKEKGIEDNKLKKDRKENLIITDEDEPHIMSNKASRNEL